MDSENAFSWSTKEALDDLCLQNDVRRSSSVYYVIVPKDQVAKQNGEYRKNHGKEGGDENFGFLARYSCYHQGFIHCLSRLHINSWVSYIVVYG